MAASSPDDNLWLRRYRPAQNAAGRLVCFPHAGGSASFYLPVAAALSPEVDVLAVQYPGRQDRRSESPIDDIAVLADEIAGRLQGQPELPTTFFGHSMGAVVAFEAARRLESDGQAPVWLFASGRRAPSTHRDETVHLRDDDGILSEIRTLDGTASALLGDDEMMRAVLPALRADYRAIETYQQPPGVTVSCPISVLIGVDDPKTSQEEASAWAAHTTGPFDLQVFGGGHFYLTERPGEVITVLARHFQLVRTPH